MKKTNIDNKVLGSSHTINPSTFTWDDFAKPLDTEEFMRERLNYTVSLLSNITDLLGIPRLSEDDMDRVFYSIIRIYKQHSDSLWANQNYTEQFKHIKTKNKPQELKDDLYECTYLTIKRIVLDEVDRPMQDMVLNKIIEISINSEAKVMSKEELINKISQLDYEREHLSSVQEELDDELEHFDDILIEVAISNDKEGHKNYSMQLSHYALEDIVQVLFGLTSTIFEHEDITDVSDTLLDIATIIIGNVNDRGEFYDA